MFKKEVANTSSGVHAENTCRVRVHPHPASDREVWGQRAPRPLPLLPHGPEIKHPSAWGRCPAHNAGLTWRSRPRAAQRGWAHSETGATVGRGTPGDSAGTRGQTAEVSRLASQLKLKATPCPDPRPSAPEGPAGRAQAQREAVRRGRVWKPVARVRSNLSVWAKGIRERGEPALQTGGSLLPSGRRSAWRRGCERPGARALN